MKIELQDEQGRRVMGPVVDNEGILTGVLTRANANEFPQLQHLDLYGDTTFNASQLQVVGAEWERLMPHARDESDRSLLRSVGDLIARGKDGPHRYLKFIGD